VVSVGSVPVFHTIHLPVPAENYIVLIHVDFAAHMREFLLLLILSCVN
jgi:hypothetical protein